MFLKSAFRSPSVSNLDPSPSNLVKSDRALSHIPTDSYIVPAQAFTEPSCYPQQLACLPLGSSVLVYSLKPGPILCV